MPAGLTYTGATPSQGGYVTGSGVWTVGSLAGGAGATLAITASVDAGSGGATLASTSSITTSDQADHVAANNLASRSVTIPLADLGLAIAASDPAPNEGGAVTFTLTLTNHGPDAASGVAIIDALPAGLTYAGSTPSQGSYASGSGVWSVGALANGASATLALGATADAGTGGTTIVN